MKSFGQAAKRRQIKNAVRTEMDKYAEHYDLCLLWMLHTHLGHGAKRLKEDFDAFIKIYYDLKARYYDEDDIDNFGSRSDSYVIKEELKKIGFDYDAYVEASSERGA